MTFIFHKPDMDTVLTALILGWKPGYKLVCLNGFATPSQLEDATVFAIECGGAGRTEKGNFDHHQTDLTLPPACVQAYQYAGIIDSNLLLLVRYVAAVDEGIPIPHAFASEPSLSYIYSGMRLVHPDPISQFHAGVRIFTLVLEHGIDPGGPMPLLKEWVPYAAAKKAHSELLGAYKGRALLFETESGVKGGFLVCPFPGVHGLLRKEGCRVTVAAGLNPHGKSMYTIAGNGICVDGLLPRLDTLEPGWGGPSHGYIIGSPLSGSMLRDEKVIEIVREGFQE